MSEYHKDIESMANHFDLLKDMASDFKRRLHLITDNKVLMVEQLPQIWYLSFATDEGWLGGTFIRAVSPSMAITFSHIHGCNPGGEVAILGPLPLDSVKPEYINRLLLTEDEVEAAEA